MFSDGGMIGVCRAEHSSRGSEAAASKYLKHLTRGLSITAASKPCSMASASSPDRHDSTLNTPTLTPASASSGLPSEWQWCEPMTEPFNILGLEPGPGPGQQLQQRPEGEVLMELGLVQPPTNMPIMPGAQIISNEGVANTVGGKAGVSIAVVQPAPRVSQSMVEMEERPQDSAQPDQSKMPPDKCSDVYRRRRAANNISCKKSRDKPKIELKRIKIELQKCEEKRAKLESEVVSLKAALSEAKRTQKEPEVPTEKEELELKVYLKQEMEKDEVRRFEVDREASTSYKYLVSELRHIFTQLKNSSFSVGYFDEEGDEVTMATDRELATAFNQMTGPLYKFTINLRKEKKRKKGDSSDSNTESDKKEEDDHPSSVMEDTDEKRRKKKKRAAQAFKEKRDASTTEKVVPHLARQTVSVPAQPPDLLTHSYGPLPGQLRPQLQRRGAQAVEADQRVDVAGARPVRADDAVLRCQERGCPLPPEYWRHPSTRIVKRDLPPRDK